MTDTDTTETTSPGATRPASLGRRALVAILMTVGVILAPLIIVTTWTRNQLLDTNRYVANIGPLASNPAIIDVAAADATNALFKAVDVENRVDEALPDSAGVLAGPLTNVIRQFTEDAARRALQTDAFQTIWNEANRVAHGQIEKALTGGGDALTTNDGMIVLDLSPIVKDILSFLDNEGVTFFDGVTTKDFDLQFELFDASGLARAQAIVSVLDTITYVLPFIMVLCFGLALWLSPNRRRSVFRGGIGIAIAATVTALAVALGRSIYLYAVSGPGLPRAALEATWDILVRYMTGGLRALIAAGVLIALSAWITGPSRAAVRIRSATRDLIAGASSRAEDRGLELGQFGQFVRTYATALRVAGVALGGLYLLAVTHVSAGKLILAVVVVLAYLAVIEFIVRAARVEAQ